MAGFEISEKDRELGTPKKSEPPPAAPAAQAQAAPTAPNAPVFTPAPGDASLGSKEKPALPEVPGGIKGTLGALGNAVWDASTFGMGAELDAVAEALANRQEGESFGDAYQRALTKLSGQGKALREQNPEADAVGYGLGSVPGVMSGPVTRGAGALYGAVTGGIEGAAEGETPGQRATGAATGALGGAAGGFFGPEIGRAGATIARSIASKLPTTVTAGIERIADALLAKGVSPAEAERMIIEAEQRGQPLTLGDIGGEPTIRQASKAAIQSPEGDAILREVSGDRTKERADRTTAFLQTLSPGSSTAAERKALQDRARLANKPAYDAAYAEVPSLWNETLQGLTTSDAVRKAIADVERKSSDRAAAQGARSTIRNPFVTDPQTGALKLRDPNVTPGLEFWDQVQRNLNEDITAAPVGALGQKIGPEGARISEVRNALMGELRKTASYDKAIGQAASFFGEGGALDWGKQLAATNYDPETFQKAISAVGAMKPAERKLAQAAYLDTIAHRANEITTNTNVAQRNLGGPNDKKVVEALFGPEKAAQVNAFVDVENLMARFDNRALGGSQTAQRTADVGSKTADAGSIAALGGLATGAGGLASGNTGTMAAGATAAGAGLAAMVYGKIKGEMAEGTAKAVAERLVSRDPGARQQVYQIMQHSPKIRDAIARAARELAAEGSAAAGGGYGGRNEQ